ncbi:MAG: hypothetical protein CMN30_01550 [Sandaracinus sp.]|nr:hypothetical protein [Sandaracinus sp.]
MGWAPASPTFIVAARDRATTAEPPGERIPPPARRRDRGRRGRVAAEPRGHLRRRGAPRRDPPRRGGRRDLDALVALRARRGASRARGARRGRRPGTGDAGGDARRRSHRGPPRTHAAAVPTGTLRRDRRAPARGNQ